MAIPYLTAHAPDESGASRGSYTKIPGCHIRNISDDHMAVQVEHSLFEGDRMTFYQILTSRDNELDRMRPIRFYTADNTKIFDGVIIDTEYTYIGSDYMALRVNAAGWWQELARMDFHQPIEYDGTWCVNDIYKDLVRRANDRGVMKEALYTYDVTRIPEYNTYWSLYEDPTGTTFTFSNIYDGMRTLTQYLDIASSTCTYEFGLRIEALARPGDVESDPPHQIDPIDQNDVTDHIYILPFPLDQDNVNPDPTKVVSFKRFQLAAGYNVKRDYSQLANDCLAIGDGVVTQQIRTHKILDAGKITANPTNFNILSDDQPVSSHYLRVTIDNPSYVPDEDGIIEITFEELDPEDPDHVIKTVTDKFHVNLSYEPSETPRGKMVHYTSERSLDRIKVNGVVAKGFGIWTPPIELTIEEVTNDHPQYYTTIAGKSINTFGHAPKTIEGMWLGHSNLATAQARVNYAAGKHCRLYHAPPHKVYAPVLQRYVTFDNLIGNTAEFYTPYEASLGNFLITDNVYGFKGKMVTQHLMGKQYTYDWNYEDTNIYVMVGTDNVYVGTEKVTL